MTAAERRDLDLVSGLLGVAPEVVELMLQEAPQPASEQVWVAGRVVCFTGEFSITREAARASAEAQGVVVVDSVTKKTDILVAAEPGSMSGKAEKARRLGIPILSEAAFWARLPNS